MAAEKYPVVALAGGWARFVGALDTFKIGDALKKLESLHGDLPWDQWATDDLKDPAAARERLEKIIAAAGKPAKAFTDQAKSVHDAIDKLQTAHKKDAKAVAALNHAKLVSAAVMDLSDAVLTRSIAAGNQVKAALERLEADAKKKEASKPQVVDPKLLAHNNKVRGFVNKLRAGKQPKTPFAFLQNKVRAPFNRAKPWPNMSLMHVGPKAVKSCRSELEKLVPDASSADFVFFHGEVEAHVEKGKSRIVFLFETALANPKQMKDALLFQCKYSPPMQLRRQGGTEVVDEAAEGNEKDAEGEVEEEAAEPKGWQPARPTPVEDKAIEDARKAMADAQAAFDKGVEGLIKRIGEAYKGAAGADVEAVRKALLRLDALRKALRVDVAASLAAIAAAKDAKDRTARKLAAREAVRKLALAMKGEDLLDDIDGNELMPALKVVAPLRESLKRAGALVN